MQPIVLVLTQRGDAAVGTLWLFDNPVSGQVSGTVTISGDLRLDGVLRRSEDQAEMRIQTWDVQFGPATLQGRFTTDYRNVNAFGPQHFELSMEILQVMREPSS